MSWEISPKLVVAGWSLVPTWHHRGRPNTRFNAKDLLSIVSPFPFFLYFLSTIEILHNQVSRFSPDASVYLCRGMLFYHLPSAAILCRKDLAPQCCRKDTNFACVHTIKPFVNGEPTISHHLLKRSLAKQPRKLLHGDHLLSHISCFWSRIWSQTVLV